MNKQQLAAKIWASANQMRSKIEASEYKDYILGFIFYKFLSDKEERFLAENDFDAEAMSCVTEDDADVLAFVRDRLGYFIAAGDLYSSSIRAATSTCPMCATRFRLSSGS